MKNITKFITLLNIIIMETYHEQVKQVVYYDRVVEKAIHYTLSTIYHDSK